MRVHIQHGQSSIEIDGDAGEIHTVLERWWRPQESDTDEQEKSEREDSTADKNDPKRTNKKRKYTRSPIRRASTDADQQSRIDYSAIANEVRESSHWLKIDQKIVSTDKVSRSQRAKFVLWFTYDKALTSGDIRRVLNSLGVKMDAPTASKAMTDAKNDFLKDDAGPQATFRLTSLAKKNFEEWIVAE